MISENNVILYKLYDEINFNKNNYDNIISEIKLLDIKKQYNIDEQTIDDCKSLKQYIFNVTLFHLKEKNISYDKNKHLIEFSFMQYTDNLFSEYNKKLNTSPLFTTISFLSDKNNSLIFSNIDVDSYKYKEINDENSYKIIIPNKYTHLIFDSSKYYGFFNINAKYTDTSEEYTNDNNLFFLKINLWDLKSPIESVNDVGETVVTFENNIDPYVYYNNNIIFNENIINNNINEELLYNTNEDDTIDKIYDIFSKKITSLKQYTMINLNFKINNNLDYYTLFNKYGKIVDDILQLSNSNIIDKNNFFYRNKIIKQIFSKDICYWIINESEIYNKWYSSNYYNYELNIKLECLPHVLNFVLFSSNFWLLHFKYVYDIPDNVKIVFREIFVAKNREKFIFKENTMDKNYFICNVQLNENVDYQGGEIIIEDSELNGGCLLEQGSMIIYHSSKERNDKIISKGEIYMLVFILEFVL